MATGSTPAHQTRIAVAVSLLLAGLLVAGCSSAAKRPAPVSATPAETTATVTQAPTASTPPPGTVVLDQNQLATICTSPQTDSTDPPATVAGSITSVVPGAIAIISCGTQVAGYDLNAGQMLWQQPIGTDASASSDSPAKITVVYADHHIYAFETDTVPANGLIAAYNTAKLTAYDPKTGQPVWSQPVEPDNKQIDTSGAKVIEIPAKAGEQEQTIVSLSDADIALDSASGKQLWKGVPLKQNATYLGDNLALQLENSDPIVLTALDNATGRQVWQQTYPQSDLTFSADVAPELVGHTVWFFGKSGYDSFDLDKGTHTAHVLYPVSFQHVLSNTSLTMAYVDNSLRLFHFGDWSKPLWSVTSDDATPLAVTDTAILISAASGPQILSADVGSLLTSTLTADEIGSSPLAVQDGFAFNSTTVIALAPPR